MEETFRQVVADVLVKVDPSLLPQLHYADPDHCLGTGTPLINSIIRCRLDSVPDVDISERPRIDQFTAVYNCNCERRILVLIL